MNGRIYSPSLGRMLSPDPVMQAPEVGQNYNRYAYVFNNPLKYSDPSGYQACWITYAGLDAYGKAITRRECTEDSNSFEFTYSHFNTDARQFTIFQTASRRFDGSFEFLQGLRSSNSEEVVRYLTDLGLSIQDGDRLDAQGEAGEGIDVIGDEHMECNPLSPGCGDNGEPTELFVPELPIFPPLDGFDDGCYRDCIESNMAHPYREGDMATPVSEVLIESFCYAQGYFCNDSDVLKPPKREYGNGDRGRRHRK